jgi:hypothetical protein
VTLKSLSRSRAVFLCVVLMLVGPAKAGPYVLGAGLHAQTGSDELHARRAVTPPTVDGVLDDELWAGDPMPLQPWVSYNPLRGEAAQQRTDVWVGYDDKAIYFAFRCLDPEPEKIRSTISRRDNVWNDDWVAVSLDSSRAGQMAYHMFSNPSGIQMDALQTNNEDTAPDWVWQSAGRVTETGYTVEMRVPLESIRFRGGADVRMGVLFMRKNSRLGVSWASPEIAPGQWVFETHIPLVFAELHQPRVLEVIPSATVSTNQQRRDDRSWPDPSSRGDLGVSVKYGLTSTLAVDATVNPDFSQVESDAFEVEVNNRFPVFFSEKRPFFMEGLGLLNVAGAGGDSTLRTAVHTRRIIEPSAGVKLTGTAGRHTFALLSTADQSVGNDSQRFFTIGRGMRNIGGGQYVGVLVTDTEFGPEHNRVLGGDFVLRHGDRVQWNGTMLLSDTATAAGGARRGIGSQLSYSFNTRRFAVSGQGEHYDRDFQMETAFINRVGVTRGWQYVEVNFYPDQSRYAWLKRIAPFVWGNAANDRVQRGTEHYVMPGVRLNFTRQGFLRLDLARGRETFAGQRFVTGRMHVDGGAQITRWLNIFGVLERGPGIFYDAVNPFQGTRRSFNVRFVVQPNAKLNHNLSYNFVSFVRATDASPLPAPKVFDLHVINLRNTYQFTPRFLLRGIAQLDTARRRILGDFLASYELVPGTVVHAGYGALLERVGADPYEPTARAFFFKASYLKRF